MGKFTDPGVCRVRNVPRGDTLWVRVYTPCHDRSVYIPCLCREREREKRGKKITEKREEKRDSNSLLHREHGHDVKAKEGMRYIRAAECQCLGRFLESVDEKSMIPRPGQTR